MKRRIMLDTETTGLEAKKGDRILEIGAVELIDNVRTGKTYHTYINPERDSNPGALIAHGLTTEFLKDKPKFAQITDEFLEFIKGAELVIHNAKFDIGMLDAELERANKGKIWNYVSNIMCTLELDRRLYAHEKKHKLDSICERFGIDISHREVHGALKDSELLADVFIKFNELHPIGDIESDLEQTNWKRPEIKRYNNVVLAAATLSEADIENHQNFLNLMAKSDKVTPVFMKTSGMKLN